MGKVGDYTAITAPAGDEEFTFKHDPAGTPATKRCTLANLIKKWWTAIDGNNKVITKALANVNVQTGTTYTVLEGDCNGVIYMNNASANTVYIPDGLSAGFNCSVIQKGAGQTTVQKAAAGSVVVNSTGATATAPVITAQFGGATINLETTSIAYVNGAIS